MKMQALTVQNPWAWALAEGLKVDPDSELPTGIENRTWRRPHAGPLAIHAGKTWDQKLAGRCRQILEQLGLPLPEPKTMTYGAVVAVCARVSICTGSIGSRSVRCGCAPWAFPGTFHWRLINLRRLSEPFECSGRQQLWEVDLPDHLIGAA